MEAMAVLLVGFWVVWVAWFFAKRAYWTHQANARVRAIERHSPEPGEWLTPAQASWFAQQNLKVNAEVQIEQARTAATLARMARKGPWLAMAGNAVVAMGAYEAFRHHREDRYDHEDGDYGFDGVDLDRL